MRFLSFSQPWLHVVLFDEPVGKRIENRKWAPPLHMIGQRIALHAAKSWDADGVGFIARLGIDIPMRFDSYVRGAIVGVATIDRVVTESRTLGDQARWYFGPYGWVLTDVRRIPTPIAMPGAQGLRTLAPLFEKELLAQLGAAA